MIEECIKDEIAIQGGQQIINQKLAIPNHPKRKNWMLGSSLEVIFKAIAGVSTLQTD
jgi:hypothetical protein